MAKEVQKEASDKKEQTKGSAKERVLLNFNVWFSDVVNNRPDVKPHHMSAIKAHFKAIGLDEIERAEDFNEGLKNYGL